MVARNEFDIRAQIAMILRAPFGSSTRAVRIAEDERVAVRALAALGAAADSHPGMSRLRISVVDRSNSKEDRGLLSSVAWH
jgi:hypothetical protein